MTEPQILFVDDDVNILAGFKRSLHKRFKIATASSGQDGLECLAKNGPFAVVVADMQMPGMNGVEFLRTAQEQAPDTVRLMLTGNADQKTAADAVNQGHVFSFLSKPCPIESLEIAINNALKQYRLIVAEKELLEQTLGGAVKVITEVLSLTDPQAFGRAQRLRHEMKAIAQQFGTKQIWELELGAMLSQIGYVAIPGELIAKARSGKRLTDQEIEILQKVPEAGAALIEKIPRLGPVAEIVRYQRKNFDGSGFPADGISGEAIPIGARILRIVNDLLDGEEVKNSRVEVLRKLRKASGLYDPKTFEAIAACFDVYVEASDAELSVPVSLRVADLTTGGILTEDVRTKDGTLLIISGTEITGPLLQKLRNFHDLLGLEEPLFVAHKQG